MDNQSLVTLVYVAVLFVLGTAIGSFLNVVVYRAPVGMSLTEPPSSCPKCGARIPARDNLPILGWILLGGKCRRCRAGISVRYPLVEFATGILWAVVGWRLAGTAGGYLTGILAGLVELAFVSAMIVTFLVDLDHRIILDEISLGGTGVALVASALLPGLHHADSPELFALRNPLLAEWLSGAGAPAWLAGLTASFAGALAGLAFSLAIYFLGNLAFRKQIEEARREDPDIDSALGLGDVKLMTCFGAFLGWLAVPVIFMFASVMGAIVGSVGKIASGDPGGKTGLAGLANRWNTGDSVLPFGPFLVMAALGIFFLW